jgi:hypothetical protein
LIAAAFRQETASAHVGASSHAATSEANSTFGLPHAIKKKIKYLIV